MGWVVELGWPAGWWSLVWLDWQWEILTTSSDNGHGLLRLREAAGCILDNQRLLWPSDTKAVRARTRLSTKFPHSD